MANIGNIAATLSLSTAAFRAGVNDANKGMDSLITKSGATTSAMGRLDSRMSRGFSGTRNNAFQSIGFGLDDFIQQTQAAGLQAGIRAAGNNITMLASAMGPLATVAAAAGVALAHQLAPALFEAADGASQAAEDFGGLNAVLKNIESRRGLNLKIAGLDTKEEAKSLRESAEIRIQNIKEQQKAAQDYRKQQEEILKQQTSRQKPSLAARGVADLLSKTNPIAFAFGRDVVANAIGRVGANQIDPSLQSSIDASRKALADAAKEEGKLANELLAAQNERSAAMSAFGRLPQDKSQAERFRKEATSLTERFATDVEKFQKDLVDAIKLRDLGALTTKEFDTLQGRMEKELNKKLLKDQEKSRLSLGGMSEAGTQAAFSTINRSAQISDNEQKKIADSTKKTADNTKQTYQAVKDLALQMTAATIVDF